MTVYSPRIGARRADELLATLVDPHHRAIIANYRRHALLEVAGRRPEILSPELTVDDPVYRISAAGPPARAFSSPRARSDARSARTTCAPNPPQALPAGRPLSAARRGASRR